MINKIILIIIILTFNIFGWGEDGHKLITRHALKLLPAEMAGFKSFNDYIIKHSIDPDLRRRDDNSEAPRHFIDVDFYNEFNTGNMITDKAKLIELYGDSIVTAMGILPWATVETFENLTKAFKEKNRDRILILAADLAHYIQDGHQPMHTILNYDGQLSEQKGIHARYESKMVSRYLNEIENTLDPDTAEFVLSPLQYIFNYITFTNSLNPVIFDADNHANKYAASRESDEYYRLLWFKTKYITNLQMENAAAALASLIYTAWKNAGKPDFKEIN